MKKIMKYLMAYILVFGMSTQVLMPIHANEEEEIIEEDVIQEEVTEEEPEIIEEEPIVEEEMIEEIDEEVKPVTDKIVNGYIIDELFATLNTVTPGMTPDDLKVTVPSNGHYTAIVDYVREIPNVLVDTFQEGYSYRVYVRFLSDENYVISNVDQLTVKINGKNASRYSSSGGFSSTNSYVVYTYDIVFPASNKVNRISCIDCNAYVNGKIVTEAKVGDVVTVKPNLSENEVFVKWKVFNDSITLANDKAETITFTMPNSYVYISCDSEAKLMTEFNMTIPEYKIGDSITNTITTNSSDYSATITGWKINGTISHPDCSITLPNVFKEGYTYYAEVRIDNYTGLNISRDAKYNINNLNVYPYAYQASGEFVIVYVEVMSSVIQKHDYVIYNPEASTTLPKAGMKTDAIQATVPTGANYTASISNIYVSGSSTYHETFEEGYSYRIFVKLTAKEGYKFALADYLEGDEPYYLHVKINGKNASRYSSSGGFSGYSDTITYCVDETVKPSDNYYHIDLNSGVSAFINESKVNKAKPGQTVTVKVDDGVKDFESFKSTNNVVNFANPTSKTTTFVMPSEYVNLGYNKKKQENIRESIHLTTPKLEVGKNLSATFTVTDSNNYTATANRYYLDGTAPVPEMRLTLPYQVRSGVSYICEIAIEAKSGNVNENLDVYVNDILAYQTGSNTAKPIVYYRIDLTECSGLLKEGWTKPRYSWLYVGSDHEYVHGWKKINNIWYYFDENGYMKTGFVTINEKEYYFNSKGAMVTGWFTDEGNRYYADTNGVVVNGWKKIDGKWYFFYGYVMRTGLYRDYDGSVYYFNSDGSMKQSAWIKLNNEWYYVGSNGRFVTGLQNIGGKYYYFNDGGIMSKGAIKIDSQIYFFGDNGAMVTEGWVQSGSVWYYLDANGKPITGWKKVGNYWYYFDKNTNEMVTGYKAIDGYGYQFGTNGRMLTNSFHTYGIDKCYYDEKGHEVSGWKKIDSQWYYFNPLRSNFMVKGGTYISGQYYYFGEDGIMYTNKWYHYTSGWCYYDENGKEVSGWKQIKTVWYYFDPLNANYMVEDALITIGTKTYYFDAKGAMKTGWVSYNSNWYYMESNGAMVIGWKQVGSYWYYFAEDGKMVSNGAKKIDGKWYEFDAKGHWIK